MTNVLRYRVNNCLLHDVLRRAFSNLALYTEQLEHVPVYGRIRSPLRNRRPITLPNQVQHEKRPNQWQHPDDNALSDLLKSRQPACSDQRHRRHEIRYNDDEPDNYSDRNERVYHDT